ncbi:MAG: hypothetical protein U1B80_01940 [Anaerolineaceae bacterium]|nr:hypothetical protein [Anaerolineaceae bacterium]
MSALKTPFPAHKTKLGFHYFQDTQHYRQHDLQIWLPRLQAMGASWLVLQSPANRAIPEHFITGLIQAGIEPLIHFLLPLGQPVDLAEIEPLFAAYSHWGARAVILYDRPNARSAWSPQDWSQDNLVERFLDHFVPLAQLANQHGLVVIFPPLEPGGSYWDTAFLRSALESLNRRKQTRLLQDLVLSAYAWTGGHSLNWGAGGPDRYPDARPYLTQPDEPDQRGFRIADWYDAIACTVLGSNRPIILLGAGMTGDPLLTDAYHAYDEKHVRTSLSIADLLAGKKATDPLNDNILLEPLSPAVVACSFWLLASDPTGDFYHQAWYRAEDKEMPIVQAFKCQASKLVNSIREPAPAQSQPESSSPAPTNQQPQCIQHYLLLPTYDFGVAEWHLNVIRPFIRKHRPTVGFSLEEAALAAHVTVIGDELAFPEEKLSRLRHAGSIVERIQGDGTSIASQMFER